MFEFQKAITGYRVVHDESVINYMFEQLFASARADNQIVLEC